METIYVLYTLRLENISGIFMDLGFKGFTTDKAVAQAWTEQPCDDDISEQHTYEEVHRIDATAIEPILRG